MEMRIIDIIELVDMRNKNLLSDKPMGINIDKYFMPSVANTIGVDLKTYKLVPHNCFACNLMHVGRDERVPMAINKKEDPVLVSPAYLVFRVKESVDVLPDFLMLWFRRPTFDRNAWFFTAGDVRGGLDKKDFFNMEVHVPDIATQRRIVAEYQAVEKRIALNKKTIEALDEMGKTIYKKMFVDDISSDNLPDGWHMGNVGELFELQRGFDLPQQDRVNGSFPIFASTGIASRHNDFKVKAPGIITGRSGSIGEVFYSFEDFWPLNTTLWVKDFKDSSLFFTYFVLRNLDLQSLACGASAVPTLNRNDVYLLHHIVPDVKTRKEFDIKVSVLYKKIDILKKENAVNERLLQLLLSKIAAE